MEEKNQASLIPNKKTDEMLSKIIDHIFSIKKSTVYLLLILLLGFILRLIAAINLGVTADDMHFSVHAINFLHSGKLVTYDQSASLWYYVTDVFYNFLGINQISSRFAPVLFGSFSIIIIYFLVKEFFDKKTSLIASFILATSPFHNKSTISEMDIMAMFFVFFSILIFVRALKSQRNLLFLWSGILLGLGILTKVYSLLFIPVAIGYALFYKHKQEKRWLDKRLLKEILIFLFFVGMFCIPSLTHNYLLYKDKGITDLIYTNALGIGKEKAAQYYAWDTGFGHGADWKGLLFGGSIHLAGKTPTLIYALGIILRGDPLIFILGVIGFIFCFIKKKREYIILSMLVLIFVFAYLAARILLAKHYIFLLLLFIPPAAYSISTLHDFSKRKIPTIKLRHILIILFIFNLVFLGFKTSVYVSSFYKQSEVGQMMNFKDKNIPINSLVVADARIYRGEIHWMFNGREYLESVYFPGIAEMSQKAQNAIPTEVYYIECVVDDCGWGTIKDQPEFNASMEQITEFFMKNGKLEKEIYTGRYQKHDFPIISQKGILYFRVYKLNMLIDPSVFPALKKTREWFLYPIGYDESISVSFDKYNVKGKTDAFLDKIAHLIIKLAIVLAFISLLAAICLILFEK